MIVFDNYNYKEIENLFKLLDVNNLTWLAYFTL